MPESGATVPSDNVVFRLVVPGGSFMPKGMTQPLPDLFLPTDADRAHAAASARPPGLSVWDRDYTTLAQARVLTHRGEAVAFGLEAGTIREIGAQATIPLEVRYDFDPEIANHPGSEGHAVIEGLARPPGTPRATFRTLRQRLLERCAPIED